MDINVVKIVNNGVNSVKIGHFWYKWPKFRHFGGQNDVIGQKLGKVAKKFFSKFWKNYFGQVHEFG